MFCMNIEHFSKQPNQVDTWRVHQHYNPGRGAEWWPNTATRSVEIVSILPIKLT